MADIRLTLDSKDRVKKFLTSINSYSGKGMDFGRYMQAMDRLYARESEGFAKAMQPDIREKRDPDRFVAPVILPLVESARAYLVNLFLAQDPIFQAAGRKDLIDVTTQFNSLQKRDSDAEGWRSELSMCIASGLKYNVMCAEIDYVTRTSYSNDPDKVGARKEVQRQSNSIRFRNMYNVFWDKTVPARKVHSTGSYAGYVEYQNYTQILKLFEELPTATLQCTAEEALASSSWIMAAQEPVIKQSVFGTRYIDDFAASGGVTTNFTGFFDSPATSASAAAKHTGRYIYGKPEESYFRGYNKVTLYARIRPADFALRIPGDKTVQIWKFILVNDCLVSAQQMTNVHNYLPMIFCEPLADGLDYQTLSYAENVADIQEIASKLWTAELKSTNRIIGDRAIYNPLMIDPNHLKGTNASPKIPLRATAATLNIDPRLAYAQVPYNDPSLGLRIQQSQQLMALADKTVGQNPTIQGAFVKGNKTDGQFKETVQGTEARLLLLALTIETDFFTPMKEIIKQNVLQYKVDELIFDSFSGKQLAIDAKKLRESVIEFELGDGLAASAAKSVMPVIAQAFQIMQQDPRANAEWDTMGLLGYFLKISGFRRIDDFKYTPEQKQQNAVLMQQQAQAAAGGTATGTQISAQQSTAQ